MSCGYRVLKISRPFVDDLDIFGETLAPSKSEALTSPNCIKASLILLTELESPAFPGLHGETRKLAITLEADYSVPMGGGLRSISFGRNKALRLVVESVVTIGLQISDNVQCQLTCQLDGWSVGYRSIIHEDHIAVSAVVADAPVVFADFAPVFRCSIVCLLDEHPFGIAPR